MKYKIKHTTEYRYSELASLSQNEIFLSPREMVTQQVIENQLHISPEPQYFHKRVDYFGNLVHVFMVQHPHRELIVSSNSIVESLPSNIPITTMTLPWEDVVNRLSQQSFQEEREAYQFVFPSPLISVGEDIAAFARQSFPVGKPVLEGALNLIHRIFTEFTYDKNATNVDTSVRQVLEQKKGVCQDFAHFAISCLRSLGLAARYVSGYLETLPPPGKQKLVGVDASHAWLSIYVPDIGWVDLDPTNNVMPGQQHITIAWGRDYGDVTPVKGVVMGGGIHNLSVTVDMKIIS